MPTVRPQSSRAQPSACSPLNGRLAAHKALDIPHQADLYRTFAIVLSGLHQPRPPASHPPCALFLPCGLQYTLRPFVPGLQGSSLGLQAMANRIIQRYATDGGVSPQLTAVRLHW